MATCRGRNASSLMYPEEERDAEEEAKTKAGERATNATSMQATSILGRRGRRFRSTWPRPRRKQGKARRAGWSCAKNTAPKSRRAEPLRPRRRCKQRVERPRSLFCNQPTQNNQPRSQGVGSLV